MQQSPRTVYSIPAPVPISAVADPPDAEAVTDQHPREGAPADYRDLALEHLAADEHDLIAERNAYRELLFVTLERLSQATVKLERTKDSLRRLLEVEREAHVRPEDPAT